MAADYIEILSSDWALAFVKKHEKADVNQLLLNPPIEARGHVRLLVDQIVSKRKAEKKLPEWHAHESVVLPPPLSVEQASSEAAADYKLQLVRGEKLVDLTGGMGVDCLTLSEQFDETHYVERDKLLCLLLSHNAQAMGHQVQVHHADATDFLLSIPAVDYSRTTFFIDPARRDSQQKKVVLLENCEPDVTALIPPIVEKGGAVLLKTSPLLDITSVLARFPAIETVHVVAFKNEVKEVLYHFRAATKPEAPITTVNLQSGQPSFTFLRSEESNAQPNFLSSADLTGGFLFEPNAAVLKAGAFKVLAERFHIDKLAVHTHLYSSSQLEADFPGRIFQILSVLDKRAVSKLKGPIHVISRNHPLSVDSIRSRFNLKEGGSDYVFATRIGQQPVLLLARPVA